MNKDKSAVESFLEGTEHSSVSFEQPSKDPFEQEVIPETKEEEVKEDKPIPFHKDPKVQKFIDKELERRLKDFKPEQKETQTEDEFKDVIDSFTTVIGNDTPEKISALNALRKSLTGMDEKAVRRAEEKIEEIRERETLMDKEAEEELENAFTEIEDTYDVDLTSTRASKLRQEFVTFVEKIAPKRNGEIVDYPDMNSAWETFSDIKKSTATPSRAKEIASRSMSRSAETTTVPQKRIDWNAVEEHMDSLGK
jgi:hypothetical protein